MPIPAPAPSSLPTSYPGDWTGLLNGLPIGGGPPLKLSGISGWRDATQAPLGGAGQLQPRGQANGSYPVDYYMPQRVVTMQLTIEALPGGDLEATIASLEEATQPGAGEVPFTLQVGGYSTTAYGKVTARIVPTLLDVLAGFTVAQIELTCDDPRRFADPVTSGPINLPSSTGGLTWPVTFPAVWSSTTVTGRATLANAGKAAGPVTYRVNGPVTGPEIVHVESGLKLAFSDALVVSAGDWLDIDCEARTVLYNGQASRNAFLIRRGWQSFDPGPNTFFFNASSYSAAATLEVTATPVYL